MWCLKASQGHLHEEQTRKGGSLELSERLGSRNWLKEKEQPVNHLQGRF